LCFVARPMTDCRLLREIASREPQFRDVRISLIPPKPKARVNAKYRVVLSEAWFQLGLEPPSNTEIETINSFSKKFKKDCAESFCLHAEMQLMSHYEDGAAPPQQLTTSDAARKPACYVKPFSVLYRTQLPREGGMVFAILLGVCHARDQLRRRLLSKLWTNTSCIVSDQSFRIR
jgi:hypothetical protein